ncbi:YceI family protein [Pontibacter sp. G13]|uniref:YceI family protein n=1 Tax=Pontibacter sp. G13 TaxID=3074898 RepID=UPI0028895787|nr:YceI family protein [Pontibacter sp. G13]WNJ20789.1 YceI family protein [Pontibacter sp. G13]
MKFLQTITAAAFLAIGAASAQAQTWAIDPSHTEIGFNVTHLVISEVHGEFTDFQGSLTSSSEDFQDASIEFTAKVGSINTGDEKRDGHLKSPDFFDVANHPDLTFKSTSFKKVGDKTYKLTGDLTIKGVTKSVTLDATYRGTVTDPWGNTKSGFKIMGGIDRQDFGLTWTASTAAGELVVGNEIEFDISVELNKQQG